MARLSLGKNQRLKSRKAIEDLFKQGKRFSVFPFTVFFRQGSFPETLQAGFTVSSKHFRKAVMRNRIKRLTREAYRTQKTELELTLKKNGRCLQVFFVYTGTTAPEFEWVHEKMADLLKKLMERVHENPAAHT